MKPISGIILLLFSIFLGCHQKEEGEVQLRFGDFLNTDKEVNLSLISKDSKKIEDNLSYAELTDYQKIKPGKYSVEVTAGSNMILKKDLGFAKGGKFTLILFGKLEEKIFLNQTTTATKLHQIVSGAEAHTSNGFLPQMRVLDDHFEGGINSAQFRWLHLVPYQSPIAAKGISKDTINLQTSSYGSEVKTKTLDPANYTFEWHSKKSPITRLSVHQKIDSGVLYTCFVIASNPLDSGNLKTVIGKSGTE